MISDIIFLYVAEGTLLHFMKVIDFLGIYLRTCKLSDSGHSLLLQLPFMGRTQVSFLPLPQSDGPKQPNYNLNS